MNWLYVRAGKPLSDRLLALAALLVLWPLLVVLAVLVKVRLGGPVLFGQVRPGLQGRPFRLLKFRTMTDERDAEGRLLPDDIRLTHFGRFLRSTSLDELPELWNILRGEMSFVGPRPLLMDYLPHYSARQQRRHDVRPGLTGWAQINGRNQSSWEDRLEQDVWYVEHVSAGLDFLIVWLTIGAVLGRKGVSAEGHATMPRFDEHLRRTRAA